MAQQLDDMRVACALKPPTVPVEDALANRGLIDVQHPLTSHHLLDEF